MYIPKRNDICTLEFAPSTGREIGKYRPALILSREDFNKVTGLVICCAISTSKRGSPTEVIVTNLEKNSVVACNLIYTFDWKERNLKFVAQAEEGVYKDVLERVTLLIGGSLG